MLKNVGFTDEQLLEFTYNAIDASFATDSEKEHLKNIVKNSK